MTGRFINSDDTSLVIYTKHQMNSNLFVYSINRPVTFIDESGDMTQAGLRAFLAKLGVPSSTFMWPAPWYPYKESDYLPGDGSRYGMRIHPIKKIYQMHTGIDIGAKYIDAKTKTVKEGDPVIASNAGVVLDIGYNSGAGNFIVIRHDFSDKKILTKYFHLMKNSVIVTIGQKLKKGQRIAKMGSTGSSTEAHLHFEAHIYRNNRWEHFDPLELFNRSY